MMDLEEVRNIEIPDILDTESSEEEEENIVMHCPKRYIRDDKNPFNIWNEIEFKRRFRFSKESVMFGILPLIEEGLAKINNRGLPVSPVLQLLITLRFYATASFQVRGKNICYIYYNYIILQLIYVEKYFLIYSLW